MAVKIPAISKDVEFAGHHLTIMEDVLDSGKGPLRELTERVLDRAESDIEHTLLRLEDAVTSSAKSVVRVQWINTNRGYYWGSKARVFVPMGPRKRIASLGLYLDNQPMPIRLIGWAWPTRGGLDGRRELVRVCKKKLGNSVRLASEYPDDFPAWAEDDAIVWYEKPISLKTTLDDLVAEVKARARKFFKCARPLLTEFAA